MRLFVFPTLPSAMNGYGIAVGSDYNRLQVCGDDFVIWYNTSKQNALYSGYIIPRLSSYSFQRFYNVLRLRVSNDLSEWNLKGIELPENPDYIFCGDVYFYRYLRERYPNHKIDVRFHNCFARIKDRMRLLQLKANFKYTVDVFTMYLLERKIFHDKNVNKIFISNEDRNYYVSNFGRNNDSVVWPFIPNTENIRKNRLKPISYSKIIWVGSIQPHKTDSVKWFINEVYMPLKQERQKVEFHLWGGGTDMFNDIEHGIYGHGRFEGSVIPDDTETAIFINPDITGGGVKIKLMSYFEEGYTFITTPFGYEGYPSNLVDNKYCYVLEQEEWLPFLKRMIL